MKKLKRLDLAFDNIPDKESPKDAELSGILSVYEGSESMNMVLVSRASIEFKGFSFGAKGEPGKSLPDLSEEEWEQVKIAAQAFYKGATGQDNEVTFWNISQKDESELPIAEIYTDGSCRGNPGPGGWAYIIRREGTDDDYKEASGSGTSATTNSRMEIRAVIKALQRLGELGPHRVKLHSDSMYVIESMKGNYRKKNNVDLWHELGKLATPHEIEWIYLSEKDSDEIARCDTLAKAAVLGID